MEKVNDYSFCSVLFYDIDLPLVVKILMITIVEETTFSYYKCVIVCTIIVRYVTTLLYRFQLNVSFQRFKHSSECTIKSSGISFVRRVSMKRATYEEMFVRVIVRQAG